MVKASKHQYADYEGPKGIRLSHKREISTGASGRNVMDTYPVSR